MEWNKGYGASWDRLREAISDPGQCHTQPRYWHGDVLGVEVRCRAPVHERRKRLEGKRMKWTQNNSANLAFRHIHKLSRMPYSKTQAEEKALTKGSPSDSACGMCFEVVPSLADA